MRRLLTPRHRLVALVIAVTVAALSCTSCKEVKTAPDTPPATYNNPVPTLTCGARCPTSVGSVGP